MSFLKSLAYLLARADTNQAKLPCPKPALKSLRRFFFQNSMQHRIELETEQFHSVVTKPPSILPLSHMKKSSLIAEEF